jgi:CDP-4-dehydro-6-deoxyglucose reductase
VSTTYTAAVSDIRDLTHDVRLITLRLVDPPTLDFVAGQFVSFSAPKEGLSHGVTRPYSMASYPEDRSLVELLLNLVPDGPGSTFLFSLGVGDTVQFKGPAGTFVLRDYPDRHLLFVATGTGIAPIRSMLQARLPSPSPVTLVWGLRSERDLYFQDELAALAAQHPEFSFTTTLSQPSGNWQGPRGRVQPLVETFLEAHGALDDVAVYVCGGSAMIASIVAMVRARGVCPIHREQYYKDPPRRE